LTFGEIAIVGQHPENVQNESGKDYTNQLLQEWTHPPSFPSNFAVERRKSKGKEKQGEEKGKIGRKMGKGEEIIISRGNCDCRTARRKVQNYDKDYANRLLQENGLILPHYRSLRNKEKEREENGEIIIAPLTFEEIAIVGPHPEKVQNCDDKDYTNRLLQENGLTLPHSLLIAQSKEDENTKEKIFSWEDLTEAKMAEFGTNSVFFFFFFLLFFFLPSSLLFLFLFPSLLFLLFSNSVSRCRFSSYSKTN
jgi:hypothetical protein